MDTKTPALVLHGGWAERCEKAGCSRAPSNLVCPTNVRLEATLPAAPCHTVARLRRLLPEAGPLVLGCSGRPWRPKCALWAEAGLSSLGARVGGRGGDPHGAAAAAAYLKLVSHPDR